MMSALSGGATSATGSSGGFDFTSLINTGVQVGGSLLTNYIQNQNKPKPTQTATIPNPTFNLNIPGMGSSYSPQQPPAGTGTKDQTVTAIYSQTDAGGSKTNKTWLYVGIGAGVLVLVVAGFFILRKKR